MFTKIQVKEIKAQASPPPLYCLAVFVSLPKPFDTWGWWIGAAARGILDIANVRSLWKVLCRRMKMSAPRLVVARTVRLNPAWVICLFTALRPAHLTNIGSLDENSRAQPHFFRWEKWLNISSWWLSNCGSRGRIFFPIRPVGGGRPKKPGLNYFS